MTRVFGSGRDRRTVLDRIELQVPTGSTAAVLGRSGVGKTTLLRHLGLLDRAEAGEIRIDGTALGRASERRRAAARSDSIGFVFQSARLLPDLTAEENIRRAFSFGPRYRRVERSRRVGALLSEFGLEHVAGSKAEVLSGGERQRVALARALVRTPALVLADEPTGSLDDSTGDDVVDGLMRRVHTDGLALVVVTHDATLAARLDHEYRLLDGRLEQVR